MKYKVIKKGQPGIIGGGDQKYYATPVYTGETNLRKLGSELSARSTVTKTDAIAVLTGLVDLIAEKLKNGDIVRLGDLGSFRISISSEGEDSAEQISNRSIKRSRVNFRPAQEFQNALSDLSFEKVRDITANPVEEAAIS